MEPTCVFDSYWHFAAERQHIFLRRLSGVDAPWTHDEILGRYKFTNAYRASDRVSQYLIKHVIYQGDQSDQEIFFRTILFKLFNRIETWELLLSTLGIVSLETYSFKVLDDILTRELEHGRRIFSAAYIMPSGGSKAEHKRKHRNCLYLLEFMLKDGTPTKLREAKSFRKVFEILRGYPMIGDFLAYQFATDLNYSTLIDFSEMDFVKAGPGALDGLAKCFRNSGNYTPEDLIWYVMEQQEAEFERLGIEFPSLWGRPLQLIDCQNLFCEISKYARVKYPSIKGTSGRTKIKQTFKPQDSLQTPWYPPKWKINDSIENRLHPSEKNEDISR